MFATQQRVIILQRCFLQTLIHRRFGYESSSPLSRGSFSLASCGFPLHGKLAQWQGCSVNIRKQLKQSSINSLKFLSGMTGVSDVGRSIMLPSEPPTLDYAGPSSPRPEGLGRVFGALLGGWFLGVILTGI